MNNQDRHAVGARLRSIPATANTPEPVQRLLDTRRTREMRQVRAVGAGHTTRGAENSSRESGPRGRGGRGGPSHR